MAVNVSKCDYCGRIFQSIGSKICSDCNKRIDEDYMAVREYMHEHTYCSYREILENTGISAKSLRVLIEEQRIILANAEGSGRTCAFCGTEILTGRLCDDCAKKMQETVRSGKKAMPEKEEEPQKKPTLNNRRVRNIGSWERNG